MLELLPALVLALSPVQDAAKRQERVRDFVKAFFREDEKTLLALSSGRLQSDLKAYFWIRRKLHGDQAVELRAWNGDIRILRSARAKVLETQGEIAETEAEIFELSVDGRPLQCGLDDESNAVLMNDLAK